MKRTSIYKNENQYGRPGMEVLSDQFGSYGLGIKKFCASFLFFLFVVVGTPLMAESFEGGLGTATDPFLVKTAAQLDSVRHFPQAWFLQVADIDLDVAPYNQEAGWEPIGGNGSLVRFQGHYHGGGYRIRNLYINRPGVADVGLFGAIGISGTQPTTLEHIILENVEVNGGYSTGALAGRVTGNQNTILRHIRIEGGVVRGSGATGGLVGSNNSYLNQSLAAEGFRPGIFFCAVRVQVAVLSGTSGTPRFFGGLVGNNDRGLISNSYVRGEIVGSRLQGIGGIAGSSDHQSLIIHSYAVVEKQSEQYTHAGGIAGYAVPEKIIHAYYDAAVWGDAHSGVAQAKVSAEMQYSGTYKGWDMQHVWFMDPSQNDGYPVLKSSSQEVFTWIGHSGSQWEDPANWALGQVPHSGADVYIPDGNYHVVVTKSQSLSGLNVGKGAELTIDPSLVLEIKGLLSGEGSVLGEGQMILTGNTIQDLPAQRIHNLSIANLNNVRLTGNLVVTGRLMMQQGLLDLNGYRLFLGPEAILDEICSPDSSSRVYGASGSIETTRFLDKPQGDIAGLGIELYSNQVLGYTTIVRGHGTHMLDNQRESIMRWVHIFPDYSPDAQTILKIRYTEADFKGMTADEAHHLKLFGAQSQVKTILPGFQNAYWTLMTRTEVDVENRTIAIQGLNHFTQWAIGPFAVALPITLLEFKGEAMNAQKVQLQWTTAAEINNDYFVVERSRDGLHFEQLATVNSAGNSNNLQAYRLWDEEPLSGISYYQLKQMDLNGVEQLKSIISVEVKALPSDQFIVFPNPASEHITLRFAGNFATRMQMYDMQGRMVYAANIYPGLDNHLMLPELRTGIYQVMIEGQEPQMKKIFVRK